MSKKFTLPGDELNIRCPRLGHQVGFSYCRSESEGLPCFKVLDCWFEHFNVEAYLEEELESKDWETLINRPAPKKVQSLLELIEQAKKAKKENA